MSFSATALLRHLLLVPFLALASLPLFAQAPGSPVVFQGRDGVVTSFVTAVNSGGTSGSSGTPAQWMKVELHYTVAPVDPAITYLDEIQFKVWIEGRDLLDPQGKPGEGVAVGLTGDLTYVNVARTKDAYAVFYVHPSTLARYSSTRGNDDFDRVFNVHAEIYVGGKLMDAIDKKKETDIRWFEQLRAIPNLVYRQNQCPFMNADPDRYPALKLEAGK